eukprot:scaffold8106_cov107-Isochrysis_galbana.AAC.15
MERWYNYDPREGTGLDKREQGILLPIDHAPPPPSQIDLITTKIAPSALPGSPGGRANQPNGGTLLHFHKR